MAAPRDWVTVPSSFGDAASLDWIDPASGEGQLLGGRVELRAAQIQHDIIWRVRQLRDARGLRTWKAVANGVADLQLGEYQLRAIARGEDRLTLRHIAALDSFFGGLILVGNAAAATMSDARAWRERLRSE